MECRVQAALKVVGGNGIEAAVDLDGRVSCLGEAGDAVHFGSGAAGRERRRRDQQRVAGRSSSTGHRRCCAPRPPTCYKLRLVSVTLTIKRSSRLYLILGSVGGGASALTRRVRVTVGSGEADE